MQPSVVAVAVAVAVSFAAGVEYREYEGEYHPDPLTVAGEFNRVILILVVMWLLLLVLVLVLVLR